MLRLKTVFNFAVVAASCAVTVSAASVSFDLTVEFSGATPPDGAGPWLRATFTDVVGGVELELESLLTGSTEFLDVWDFNLDPMLSPTLLSFAHTGSSGSFNLPTIATGVDAFMADGDGLYDIEFEFDNAPPADRFGGSDSVSYLITSTESISALSFDFLSAPAGGHGPFPTAAHVQGTGGGDESGWITVPEPSAVLLLALGALGASRRRS